MHAGCCVLVGFCLLDAASWFRNTPSSNSMVWSRFRPIRKFIFASKFEKFTDKAVVFFPFLKYAIFVGFRLHFSVAAELSHSHT